MRKLAAIALLFSAQAWACPDLNGAFTCKYSDGSSEVVTMSQSLKNGVTVYDYNGSLIPADNVVYTVPDDETLKQGTFKAWCDDAVTLKGELKGKYYQQGSFYGDLVMNMEFSLVGTDLKAKSFGTLKNTGGEYPINSETVCTRNP